MQKIRCLIVDDEPTAREILESYVDQIDGLDRVASCQNALEAFKTLESTAVDLILLDINMPDISGISLARAIDKKAKIIFTTAYREYAVEGFDLQAVDYLLKPISLERFLQAIQKYRTGHLQQPSVPNSATQEEADYLLIKSDRITQKVPLAEIRYIESLGDYLKVHTVNSTFVTRETISGMAERLPQKAFIRIHRSFLVALKAVTAFSKDHVALGEVELTISRSYRETAQAKLNA